MNQRGDREAIHHFRVELKKLRAFLRLLTTPDLEIKIPGSLKKLYRKAGSVRDLQLHQKNTRAIMNKNKAASSGYSTFLKRKLVAARKQLRKAMKPELLRKAQQQIEEQMTALPPAAGVQKFTRERLQNIHAILTAKAATDVDMHTARKQLKDILYAAGIFKSDLVRQFPYPGWSKEVEKDLTRLADDLGSFQDARTMIAHTSYSNREASTDERKWLAGLRRGQLRIKNRKKQAIKQEWKQHDHFLPLLAGK